MAYVDLDKVISVDGSGTPGVGGADDPYNYPLSYEMIAFNVAPYDNNGDQSVQKWIPAMDPDYDGVATTLNNNYQVSTVSGTGPLSITSKTFSFDKNVLNITNGRIKYGVYNKIINNKIYNINSNSNLINIDNVSNKFLFNKQTLEKIIGKYIYIYNDGNEDYLCYLRDINTLYFESITSNNNFTKDISGVINPNAGDGKGINILYIYSNTVCFITTYKLSATNTDTYHEIVFYNITNGNIIRKEIEHITEDSLYSNGSNISIDFDINFYNGQAYIIYGTYFHGSAYNEYNYSINGFSIDYTNTTSINDTSLFTIQNHQRTNAYENYFYTGLYYNTSDNKIYFIQRKYDGSGPTTTYYRGEISGGNLTLNTISSIGYNHLFLGENNPTNILSNRYSSFTLYDTGLSINGYTDYHIIYNNNNLIIPIFNINNTIGNKKDFFINKLIINSKFYEHVNNFTYDYNINISINGNIHTINYIYNSDIFKKDWINIEEIGAENMYLEYSGFNITNLNTDNITIILGKTINTNNIDNGIEFKTKLGFGLTGGDYDNPTGTNDASGDSTNGRTVGSNGMYLDIELEG